MNNSFKVLGLYFLFMFAFLFMVVKFWDLNRGLSYSLLFFVLLMLIQLFFGTRLAAWAVDFSIKYGK